MSLVTVRIDPARAIRAVGIVAKQHRFATAQALNQTAKDFQAAERAGLAERFILRRPAFINRQVMIERGTWATKEKLSVTVTDNPQRHMLSKFETGGEKTSFDPGMPIAIPTSELRWDPRMVVPRSMYPKNLRLADRKDVIGTLARRRHVTANGVEQLKGKRRTFILDPTQHHGVTHWAIWQRFGPHREDIMMIWLLRTRVPIPRRLEWQPTAVQTMLERYPLNFRSAFIRALQTARV